MNHVATARFWRHYKALPPAVQRLADKSFELLKANPRHPSLHSKRVGSVWSVRIGLQHRALAAEDDDTFVWFWIGGHDDYDRLLS